jgi:hypothetical protein
LVLVSTCFGRFSPALYKLAALFLALSFVPVSGLSGRNPVLAASAYSQVASVGNVDSQIQEYLSGARPYTKSEISGASETERFLRIRKLFAAGSASQFNIDTLLPVRRTNSLSCFRRTSLRIGWGNFARAAHYCVTELRIIA